MPELSGDTPGNKGKVVGQAPSSAVVCRWRVEGNGRFVAAESVVPGRKLTGLVAALNSLPPGRTGDFECESGINLWYLIGFRFGDGSGTEVEADYSACGAVRTKQHYWGSTARSGNDWMPSFPAYRRGWVPVKHQAKPPFFTTP